MPAHPDSDIYPEASGPAKTLVNRHSDEQPLKLYAGWFCPCVPQKAPQPWRSPKHTKCRS